MRNKLVIALGTVTVLIVAVLVSVAMQPTDYRVARSATIEAPPAQVFPHINNLHKWEDWSPWAKLDPHAKNSFEGPEAGKGAKFYWEGNSDVGVGSMEITQSKPDETVGIVLAFKEPFEDQADVVFDLEPAGERTHVTWSMSGKKNFMSKFMCMFMNMDEMIGGDFEKGLANLKQVAEADPEPTPAPTEEAINPSEAS